MTTKVIDFQSQKQAFLHKRKEAKVDQLRKAFRLARGESGPDQPGSQSGTGRRAGKSKKK